MFRELAKLKADSPEFHRHRDSIVERCLPLADHIARRFDGRGEPLVSAKSTIDWKKVKDFSMELPTPPRSGTFWLETRYREANGPVDVTRRKINLQFLTSTFAPSAPFTCS